MDNLKIFTFIYLLIVVLISSCTTAIDKNSDSKDNASNDGEIPQIVYTADGKPKAEKGITVVSKTGWTADQMEFQQRYCESMFGQLEGYDSVNFCLCFLDKVQYYYEPIYVREAYEDQKKWNSFCLNESIL